MLWGCRMYRMCRRPRRPGPCSSFTLMPGCFLTPGDTTPQLFFHHHPPPPSALPATPTLPKLSMHFVFHPAPGGPAPWMPGVFARSGAGRASCKVRGSPRPCPDAGGVGKSRAFPRHPRLATSRDCSSEVGGRCGAW